MESLADDTRFFPDCAHDTKATQRSSISSNRDFFIYITRASDILLHATWARVGCDPTAFPDQLIVQHACGATFLNLSGGSRGFPSSTLSSVLSSLKFSSSNSCLPISLLERCL